MYLVVPNIKKYFIPSFLLFLVSGGAALIYSKLSGVTGRSGGNFLFQTVSLFIYGWAFFFLVTKYKDKFLYLLLKSYPLFLLIIVCLVSSLWAIEPVTSFRRGVALLLTYTFCLYLVVRYEEKEILLLILGVFFFIGVFGALAILIPGWGIDQNSNSYVDAIRGLAGHKNDFGRYMALGVLFSWFLYTRNIFAKSFLILCFILFFLLLLGSQSKTPLAVVFFVILISPFANFYVGGKLKKNIKHSYAFSIRSIIFFVFFPVIIFIVISVFGYVLDLLGKDFTFTGRTFIWEYALNFGEQHKWFGAGYRSFWVDGWGSYTFWGTNTTIRNGHNGFLDVYLELGYFGFSIFVFFIFSFLKSCINNKNINPFQVLALLLLIFYLCYSVTEQMTLKQSELLWMLIMIFYLKLINNKYSCTEV